MRPVPSRRNKSACRAQGKQILTPVRQTTATPTTRGDILLSTLSARRRHGIFMIPSHSSNDAQTPAVIQRLERLAHVRFANLSRAEARVLRAAPLGEFAHC